MHCHLGLAKNAIGAYDCVCPTGLVLVEKDVTGNKLSAKQCLSCPSGTQVDECFNILIYDVIRSFLPIL